MDAIEFDGVLVIGGGLAGLSAALAAAPRRVRLLSPAPLGQACSSSWAVFSFPPKSSFSLVITSYVCFISFSRSRRLFRATSLLIMSDRCLAMRSLISSSFIVFSFSSSATVSSAMALAKASESARANDSCS